MGVKDIKSVMYRGVSDFPTHNFYEVKDTGNLMYMVVGYDGYNDVAIPPKAEERYHEIFNDFCELTGNNKTFQYYESLVEAARLQTRFVAAKALLEALRIPSIDTVRDDIIEELREWKFYLNKEKDFTQEYKRLQNQLRSAKTRYELKRKEAELFEQKKDTSDILEIKLSLEAVLEKNNIDLKKTSLKEWAMMLKRATEISAAKKKWQSK